MIKNNQFLKDLDSLLIRSRHNGYTIEELILYIIEKHGFNLQLPQDPNGFLILDEAPVWLNTHKHRTDEIKAINMNSTRKSTRRIE